MIMIMIMIIIINSFLGLAYVAAINLQELNKLAQYIQTLSMHPKWVFQLDTIKNYKLKFKLIKRYNMTGRKNSCSVSTSRCPIQSLRKVF